MSHGIGPQYPSENGRSEGLDESGELPLQLPGAHVPRQLSHQSLQFSPIPQYVSPHQQQHLQAQLPHHHQQIQQQQQEAAYQQILSPQFRGCVDPSPAIAYSQLYYQPHVPYLQIPFNPYMRQQQQQQQQQTHQQSLQQQSAGNASQDITPGTYSGNDIPVSNTSPSDRVSYAQKASSVNDSSDSGNFTAPGRGVPLQSSQPAMLQQQHNEPHHHQNPHQHQLPQHQQQLMSIRNPERGSQFKVSEYLPKFISEVNAEKLVNEVNPTKFMEPHVNSRFFVIKSYSEEDVHRAIKYSIWCSSKKNNDILDKTFKEVTRDYGASSNSSAASTPSSTNADCDGSYSSAFLKDQPMVYLFFSVNGSGHFCGVSRLASKLYSDYNAGVWCQEKWTGLFYIRWLYVKDVPNAHLRHIRLQNNENKPVTNTRDGHEVDFDNGVKVLKVIHEFRYSTTLFDDYDHYDRLEADKYRRRETHYNRIARS